ncbi:MAG: dihydroxyacetone kinase subunit DhaK [Planctomycetaceae bacterium]|nr:dihydroxyacetone kinase subunit DhaK [Planctomycetaceae bacterium]
MKKFINSTENITQELLQGYVLACPQQVQLVRERIVVRTHPKPEHKTAVVAMMSTGHEPALTGYVGEGMADAVVAGDIFTPPGAAKIAEMLQLFRNHSGMIFIVPNHASNVMNANLAMITAGKDNINVRRLLVAEDIALGQDSPPEHRRGLVGAVPLIKIAGAAAEAGRGLDDIMAIAEKFSSKMATLTATFRTATNPQTGHYLRELPDDMMDIGMGQHGTGGGEGPLKILTADETAELLLNRLLDFLRLPDGSKVLLLINGCGATTLMEMFIIFRKAHQLLTGRGMTVAASRCGEIMTTQEAAGIQMFLAELDDETLPLYEAPSNAPYWTVR